MVCGLILLITLWWQGSKGIVSDTPYVDPSLGSIPQASKTTQHITPETPVNPRASIKAKQLLALFYKLRNSRDTRVIVGQHVGGVNEGAVALQKKYQKYFTNLRDSTGELPALMGVDYGWETQPLSYTETNAVLIKYAKEGGLIEVSMSPGNPFTGGGLRDFTLGGHPYDDVITEGKEANTRWKATLDKTAEGLAELQDAGVVVLFRPLHEMNGDFFWWSYGEHGRVGKEEYQKLWRYIYDYLTKNKKLNNLLWVYSPNASQWENGVKDTDFYYPGDQYVDMVGMDYYADDMSQVNNHGNYDKLIALNKPFGFAEIGPQSRSGFDNNLVLEAVRTKYPQTVYAMYWTGWSNLGVLHTKRGIIENANAKAFMNNPIIITLKGLQKLF